MSSCFRLVALLPLCVILVLASCGKSPQAPDENLKVYRHSEDSAPTSLDPVNSAIVYASLMTKNLFDTLYTYKYLQRPYELKPNLAEGMPEISEDGLTYTIRIKKGTLFADDPVFEGGKGREVTVHDFIYSIKRHFDPKNRAQGAWLWQGRIVGLDDWKSAGADYDQPLEGLKALDPYTVQIKLVKPYPQLLFTFAMGFSGIVPREAVEKYGREFSIRPVGSGPFKLVSFSTQKAVMEPNPNFRKEPVDIYYEGYDEALHGYTGVKAIHGRVPPFVDRLEVHFIEQSAARWNSLTKGNEIHYGSVPKEHIDNVVAQKQPKVVLKPEYAKRFNLKSMVEAGLVYATFNMDDPDFGRSDDPRRNARNTALRCAIRSAFDWPERIDRMYMGVGSAFAGIIPPAVPEFDPNQGTDALVKDVEGAKKLLAEHGWNAETLPNLEYASSSGVTYRQFFEQFRGWLINIGYPREKIKHKTYTTFGDFNRALKQRKIQYISMGWGLDYPDAENTLQLFYGPNQSPGANSSNYVNPEYDALYEQSAVMQPSPERTAIYRKMNQMLIDDCIIMNAFARTRVFLWHKDAITFPDRQILGGFSLKYVDIKQPTMQETKGS